MDTECNKYKNVISEKIKKINIIIDLVEIVIQSMNIISTIQK